MLSLHKLDLNGPLGVVKISATEATLLQAFSQSPDARLDFQQVAQCMGLTPTPDEDYKTNIQVRMVRLRKKMHEAGAQGAVIESIRNVGYQFFEALEIRK